MWRKYLNPLQPQLSDEENYHSTEEDDPNLLVSPRRPHQSPRASPRALLQPDPPPVAEVLEDVDRQLRNLPPRQQRAERRDAHRLAQEQAAAAALAAAAAAPAVIMAFEDEDGTDEAKALQEACHNLSRYQWNQDN